MQLRKSKFLPYDRILDGIEMEDLIDEDESARIIRILNRKHNTKMFMLERTVLAEKEHSNFIKEIQGYEQLNSNGLLQIEHWSCNMLIDQFNLTKYYKFIIMFNVYSVNIRTYIEGFTLKKTSMCKEDILRLYKTFTSTLHYMYQNEITNFNPICPSCFMVCSDSSIRFNAFPILTTKSFMKAIVKESVHFAAPETLATTYTLSQNPQQRLNSIYTAAIFSFGLLFLQIFLMKPVDFLNQKPDLIKQYLKEVEAKFGEVYSNFLAGMLEYDPIKRIKIKELNASVESSEYFSVSMNLDGPKFSFSEDFENYKHSYEVDQSMKPIIRTIGAAIQNTHQVLMSNLFDKKNVFLELLDLKSNTNIPEGAQTIISDNGRVLIMGGYMTKAVYELKEVDNTLFSLTSIPECISSRVAFGSCILKQEIVICSGVRDQESKREITNSTHFLHISSLKWREGPQVLYPVIGCTLVPFNDEILFKYGGSTEKGNVLGQMPNVVERLDFQRDQWVQIDYQTDRHYPFFILPSLSVCIQINPAQVLILGGDPSKKSQVHRPLIMNIDVSAHSQETGADFFYVEFGVLDVPGYNQLGKVLQVQMSNNEIFVLSKKDEKYHGLFSYHHVEGFKQLRKIFI